VESGEQGYLMLAVQMSEGGALSRTTATLTEATKVALEIPGVDRVITLSGMSLLDNSADLFNAGAAWVMLKPFDERLKAKDQDLLSIFERLQKVMATLPDGQPYVLPPPAIQGIGNAGGFQMQLELLGGSTDYEKLGKVANQMIAAAASDPALRSVLTTFRTSAPHVTLTVDRDRAQTLRVSVGDIFSTLTDFVGSTYV